MRVSIYKFVKWEIPALDTLKGSKVYCVAEKLNKGEKLSREEKDWLAENLSKGWTKCDIRLMGWCFNFREAVNNYVAKQYGSWAEYYAPDKTSLRKALYGRVDRIVEVA